MKNLYKFRMALTLVVMMAGMATAMAQTNPLPVPSVGNLYKQGTNSSDKTGPVALESPDLVTAGTTVPYLVIPDPDLNPGWATAAATDATTTSGITSSWIWTVSDTISSTTHPGTGHYVTVPVVNSASTKAALITVQEIGKTPEACPGSTSFISVLVVNKPTVTKFTTPGTTSVCASGTNNSLGTAIPTYTVDAASDSRISTPSIKVKATLTMHDMVANKDYTIFTDKVFDVNASTGVIDETQLSTEVSAGKAAIASTPIGSGGDFDTWGTYTLTITKISDKISRKDISADKGEFDVSSLSLTYTVLKTPVTGPIYHFPNN